VNEYLNPFVAYPGEVALGHHRQSVEDLAYFYVLADTDRDKNTDKDTDIMKTVFIVCGCIAAFLVVVVVCAAAIPKGL